MAKIILISGKAGVGKTTAAEILFSLLPRANLVSFAKGVKDTAKVDFGWDGEKDSRGRRLLQEIGRIGRNYNEDIWVEKSSNYINILDKDSTSEHIYIIDDWRFPNEYKYMAFHYPKVLRIRIEAPEREMLKGTPEYDDVSEISLPTADAEHPYYDVHIYNIEDGLDTYNMYLAELVNRYLKTF